MIIDGLRTTERYTNLCELYDSDVSGEYAEAEESIKQHGEE